MTDRDRAVEEMTGTKRKRQLDRLVADGVVVPRASERRTRPERIAASEPVSPLVIQQRR